MYERQNENFHPKEETSTAFMRKMGIGEQRTKRDNRLHINILFPLPTQWYDYFIRLFVHSFVHSSVMDKFLTNKQTNQENRGIVGYKFYPLLK